MKMMIENKMTAPEPLVGASEGQSMCYDNIIPPFAENVKPVLRIIQGNSIYFLGKKRISRNKLGSKAALNINFFLLILPY